MWFAVAVLCMVLSATSWTHGRWRFAALYLGFAAITAWFGYRRIVEKRLEDG